MTLFVHAVAEREDRSRVFRVAALTNAERDALLNGDLDIREPFFNKPCPLAVGETEGIRVTEISVPKADRELPDALVTLSDEKTREKQAIARVREGFRRGLSEASEAVKSALSGHDWVAEGRGGYAYDDPGYAGELADMRRSADAAFAKVKPVADRARALLQPFGRLADPLRAEIARVQDAVRKADVLTVAATTGAEDLPDDAVRIQARMWCTAMSDLRDVLTDRLGDWSECVKDSAIIAQAVHEFQEEPETPGL